MLNIALHTFVFLFDRTWGKIHWLVQLIVETTDYPPLKKALGFRSQSSNFTYICPLVWIVPFCFDMDHSGRIILKCSLELSTYLGFNPAGSEGHIVFLASHKHSYSAPYPLIWRVKDETLKITSISQMFRDSKLVSAALKLSV